MKKILTAVFLSLIMLTVSITLCGGIAMADSVHYFQGENIGDVHPYWDEQSQTWYMFYLKTDGRFSAALMRSKDMLNWEPVEISSQGALAAYYVLGVQKAGETY